MRHRAAWVQQLCAHRSDLRSLDMLGHDRQPLGIDDFNIVIEEKKPCIISLVDRVIFGCGIIGHAWEMQQAMRKARRTGGGGARRFVLALEDENLIAGGVCFAGQAFDAPLDRLRAVATAADYRNLSHSDSLGSTPAV